MGFGPGAGGYDTRVRRDGWADLPTIANEYAWLLGATGMSQAVAIIAGAMGVRFLLQSVPFVRWGS
ncbi:MAG: hypothetical protein ACHQX3_07785 [Nitrospirales bacterium]